LPPTAHTPLKAGVVDAEETSLDADGKSYSMLAFRYSPCQLQAYASALTRGLDRLWPTVGACPGGGCATARGGGGNGAGAVAYCAGGIDPRGSSRLTTAGQGKGITVARGPGPTADNPPHIDVSTDLSLTGNEKAPVTRPLSISALLGTETSPSVGSYDGTRRWHALHLEHTSVDGAVDNAKGRLVGDALSGAGVGSAGLGGGRST
jgi:hypothetical protein